ncbi:arf-GAP with dual PH domain-containing protein 1 isoform 4-T4 [Syngnathus typhle]
MRLYCARRRSLWNRRGPTGSCKTYSPDQTTRRARTAEIRWYEAKVASKVPGWAECPALGGEPGARSRCLACSLLHRSIPHISRVKSIRDTWEASEVEIMADLGNNVAQAKYEQNVPAFYYRPTHTDCKMLREQWIRAKYERNEFEFIEKQEPYTAGYREGFLWKRGRDNGQFLSRKFILSEREGALKYFNKQDARDPKAIMKIETLNATFQPAKIGNPCGLQITYLKDNSTRNIFVYHSDAKEMIDWFNAIRAARFHYLQVAFPGASNEEFCCFPAGAKIDPKLHEGRLYGENRSKAHRRLQEEMVHYGRQATDVF